MTGPCCSSCDNAELKAKARRYLRVLGKMDHPDAERDPISALGQVAVDLAQALALSEGIRLGGASVHRETNPPSTPYLEV